MDQATRERLEKAGIDCAELLDRIGGSEDFMERLLLKFPADGSYSAFKRNIREGKPEDAAGSIHTLKGLAANMGMKDLRISCVEMEGILRSGSIPAETGELDARYDEIVRAISDSF